MLKSKKIVDWLYDYSLYFIIGALLLVIIAIEPSFVRVSNFTTILTQSATKIIYACGIAGIIVLGGTDLALGREVGLAAVVAASLLQAVDYSQRVFSADQVPALPLIVPLLLVMVLLGIICAAHGFIVAHWGVAPFVASLGVQLISYGLCLQYFNTVCNSNPLSGFTKTYSKFCQGTIRIGNISLSYLMFYAKNRGWVYYGGLWPYIGGIRRLWWRNAGNFLARNGKHDKTYHLRRIVCRSGGYACIRVFL